MNIKGKNLVFFCELSEDALKVVKCSGFPPDRRQIIDAAQEHLTPGLDEKHSTETLARLLKKMGFSNNTLAVSLPRSKATCRYLKVPSQQPEEIEKIVSLQISKYLPYNATELISGYQIVQIDKEGYSHINLTILHKDIISHYLRILDELKPAELIIVLSSYGLAGLCAHMGQKTNRPVMLVDYDSSQAELAVILNNKLIFSRYFKTYGMNLDTISVFAEEIKKSCDAYAREISQETLEKIVLVNSKAVPDQLKDGVAQASGFVTETLVYPSGLKELGKNTVLVTSSEHSFARLLGLCFVEIEDAQNLLPPETKAKTKHLRKQKEIMQAAGLLAGAVIILGLAVANNLNNKTNRYRQLKEELLAVEKEAKSLSEITDRAEMLQRRAKQQTSILEIISELHKVIPPQVFLSNFIFEEDNKVTLRGHAPELNLVLDFVGRIERSPAFKDLRVKVRYATKKNTPAGEVIDFEILCQQE